MISQAREAGPRFARNDKSFTNCLTTISKERLQHFGAASSKYSAANLNLVVQERMIHDLHDRMHGARLRIIRAINETPDTGMHQRSCAHGARFNCSKELALSKTVVTYGSTGLAQRHDLSVGCGIGICDVAVPSSTYDVSVADDDGSHWYFSDLQGALGTAQRFFHPKFIGGGAWLRIGRQADRLRLFCLGARAKLRSVF